MLRYTVKLLQASFSARPKAFDIVNMPVAIDEFVDIMNDTEAAFVNFDFRTQKKAKPVRLVEQCAL